MKNDVDKELREKILSLLNDSGRSEAETAMARKLAAQLMAQHGLTEEQVMSDDAEMLRVDLDFGRLEWILAKFIMCPISRLTGTICFFISLRTKTGGRSDRKLITFAGYGPDVEWAEWLINALRKQAEVLMKGLSGDRAKSDAIAAFTNEVSKRLFDLCDDLGRERTDQANALVPVKNARIHEWLDVRLQDVNIRGRGLKDLSAAAVGLAAGQNASLSRPISTSGQRRLT